MINFIAQWTFDPAVMAGAGITALLYWRGMRYSMRRGVGGRLNGRRAASFAAGLVAVIIALESPIDAWSDRYLWAHMLQHELLIVVAAPLLVLGSPALPLFRAIPLGARRGLLRWGMQQGWRRGPWRRIGSPLLSPVGSGILFVGDFAVWHLPPLYDLALEQAPVHYLEHLLFLGTAVLFWAQIIPSPPLPVCRSLMGRAVLLGSVALSFNLLDVVYISVPVPIYQYRATIPHSAGMMSALVDQSVAAGVMGGANAGLLASALLLWRRSGGAGVQSRVIEGEQDPAHRSDSPGLVPGR